ncbi:MAG TPA: glutaredoxin family protein [Albitalea sp.]|jgi:glutaredoxin|nr:glutaredoxin family protein [Albitalea sp.]
MKKIGRWLIRALPLAALCVVLPAQALYKVVAPDGRVTYTDTPPPPSSGSRVIKLGPSNVIVTETGLPLELRQPVQRYPVTLYTMKVCEPCESARQLLRQRGIPFNERLVATNDDLAELQRLSGAREAPTLSIGAQVLRGLAPESWNSYLDSAGYPRESRLPATYQNPPATPLIEPPAPVARQPAQRPADPVAPQEPAPGGIKF